MKLHAVVLAVLLAATATASRGAYAQQQPTAAARVRASRGVVQAQSQQVPVPGVDNDAPAAPPVLGGLAGSQQQQQAPVAAAAPCDLSLAPAKCRACLTKTTKARAPGAALKAQFEPACAACASLPTLALQDYCIACLNDNGPGAGCTGCSGRLQTTIAQGLTPGANDVTIAANCYGCYAEAKASLRSTYACVPCWLSPSITMRDACSSCVATAQTEQEANICTVCGGQDKLATEKSCYACMAAASAWPAKALCGVPAAPAQDARMARGLLNEFFGCLAAARSEAAAQLCTTCFGAPDRARGRRCFTCLGGLYQQEIGEEELALRAGLCALPPAAKSKGLADARQGGASGRA